MPTQITQFPPAPQHTDSPAVFSTKGDNFIAAFPQFVTEANQLAADLNVAMNSAYLGNTATSTTSVAIGTGTKNFTVEVNKNFVKGMTLKIAFDATNYMIGEITSYNSSTGALVISVITTLGSGTYAVWSVSPTVYYTPSIIKYYLTASTTLDYTVSGKVIEVSGNFSIFFAPSATLGNGWYIWMKNVGVRDITLDPSGSETIDGNSTAILKPGCLFLVYCNGTSLQVLTIVNADTPDKGFKNRALVTTTSTWTKPVGVTRVRAYAVGAGAAGHVVNGSGAGGGLAWADIDMSNLTQLFIDVNSSQSAVSTASGTVLLANAASGVTPGTASINGTYAFNGGASTGGAGGGVGGASSGTIFGTGVAGSATAAAGGSGWGGNGSAGGGGGIGSASGGAFSGGTGANQGGRGILNPFTDPLILTFNGAGQPHSSAGTSPYYSPDGVGGCSASAGVSGNPATAGNGGFGAGGGGSDVSVGAGTSTAGNGGFGGGGGSAVAQTSGIANAGAGGYGGGGGKASGGSTNNQGAGGAGAVIILY